jgi:hypothetical protein
MFWAKKIMMNFREFRDRFVLEIAFAGNNERLPSLQ